MTRIKIAHNDIQVEISEYLMLFWHLGRHVICKLYFISSYPLVNNVYMFCQINIYLSIYNLSNISTDSLACG